MQGIPVEWSGEGLFKNLLLFSSKGQTKLVLHIPYVFLSPQEHRASQMVLVVKNLPANTWDKRDMSLIPGLGRSPGGGHGNPLQYSCLEDLCGQQSLVGYSQRGHKESDTTEQLSTQHRCEKQKPDFILLFVLLTARSNDHRWWSWLEFNANPA